MDEHRLTRRAFVAGAGAAVGAAALGSVAGSLTGPRLLPGSVAGRVRGPAGLGVRGARVTLEGGAFFREVRTDAAGAYGIAPIPQGTYALGASAPGLEYKERVLAVAGAVGADIDLGLDTHPGAWEVLGDTAPERFGGTNSGTLLPDGRIFWCHDTIDPVLFDPVARSKTFPGPSPSSQGCHMPVLLDDGRLLVVGGGTEPVSYLDPVKTVKAWDPVSHAWEAFPDLLERRWYPSMVRLADGRLLVAGGGIGAVAPYRTAKSEVYDPVARRPQPTGDLVKPGGFDPIILLRDGEVFSGFNPPQRWDPATGRWRLAAPMLQPNRDGGGRAPVVGSHPDHSIVMLEDGQLAALGLRPDPALPPRMVEVYDPMADAWSYRSNPASIRSMAEVCTLPTGQVFVGAGKWEAGAPAAQNPWGYTAVCDLWDPSRDAWRRAASMTIPREYHAITMLVPDGRVVVTGGAGQPGIEDGDMRIEAYSPPYLFRGPRPRIEALSTRVLVRGLPFFLAVGRTEAATGVVLLGMQALSHWMDAGPQRFLRLPFTQTGPLVRADLPASASVVPPGWYMVMVLVDDIPSPGAVVRVAA